MIDPVPQSPSRSVICDTDVLATAVWHEQYVGESADWILQRATAHQPAPHILTGAEIPFVQVGLRDAENIRHQTREPFREVLQAQAVPWIEVAGATAKRAAACAPVLE